MTIRLLLVDDHDLVRTGISRLLEDTDDIRVIAEAANGEQAILYVRANPESIDIILMDVSMPGMGGLETTKRLTQSHPQIPIIVVSVHSEKPFPNSLLKAGASGYLHKGCSISEIERAIHDVKLGKRYLSKDVAQAMALASVPGMSDDTPFEHLSNREVQVMTMMSSGFKVGQIADSLSLSPKTISTYRRRIFQKLGVQNDVELTRVAIGYGLLDSGN